MPVIAALRVRVDHTIGKKIMFKRRLCVALMAPLFMVSVLAEENARVKLDSKIDMEKVTGVGGLFFRAENPEALSRWYEEHLGISPVPKSYDQSPWIQEEGPIVFAPFPMNSDYFGSKSQTWMINFRVNNLEKIVSQLTDAGIEVVVGPEDYPNGYFARLSDPEGNPIQLWQPK